MNKFLCTDAKFHFHKHRFLKTWTADRHTSKDEWEPKFLFFNTPLIRLM